MGQIRNNPVKLRDPEMFLEKKPKELNRSTQNQLEIDQTPT